MSKQQKPFLTNRKYGDLMATLKEIRNHIESIRETQKITNAMYLIASAKLRRAKSELDQTKPYFAALRSEIKRIFRTDEKVNSRYFYPLDIEPKLNGTYAYLVITADKGLAGAYNQNVIEETARMLKEHGDAKLFVVGEYGRQYFLSHNIPIEQSFHYTAQNPIFERAREIGSVLLDFFDRGEIQKLFVVYTDFENGLSIKAKVTRLLPFHRADFAYHEGEKAVSVPFEFQPSIVAVLENMIPSYVAGFIYSALVDSFCCEQNARMTAMDSANRNAEELLDALSREYHQTRQKIITQEITEIASGAKYQTIQKQKKESQGNGLAGTNER